MRHRTKDQKIRRKEIDTKNNENWKKYKIKNCGEVSKCCVCGEDKTLSEFPSSFIIRNTCLKCVAKKQKEYRINNPAVARKISSKISIESRNYVKQAKNVLCKVCGKSWPPCAMDFHHAYGNKSSNVSKMTSRSVDRLKKEIEKCELVCANCHRDLTFSENNKSDIPKNVKIEEVEDESPQAGDLIRLCASCKTEKSERNFTKLKSGYFHSYCKKCLRKKNRKYGRNRLQIRPGKALIISHKDNKKCVDCGETFRHWVLDLDHVSGQKIANVSSMHTLAIEKIKEELKKCEIVCASCHRVRTHRRRTLDLESPHIKVNINSIRLVVLNSWDAAKEALEKYHYAGYGRHASHMFAAMHGENLAAVVKFAPVVRKEVASKEGVGHLETLELDRFCIIPAFQIHNMASKIMSMSVAAIRKERPDVRLLVSFADPAQGHDGTMYMASNWKFVGTGASSYVYESSEGIRINKKTLYDRAKRIGIPEKEYAASQSLSKINMPGKHKFVYWLK